MPDHGVFIVGAPRSGTTLLQTILAHHPELYSAPETSFFNRIIPALGASFRSPSRLVPNTAITTIESDFEYMTGIKLDLRPRLAEESDIKSVFESIMESFNHEEKRQWVEKTTNHARCMPLIQRFYPEAKFIHVIRDPVDSVGSMCQIRPVDVNDLRIRYVSPITGFARVWQKCVTSALSFPNQEQVCHVSYEDILGDPKGQIQRVCEFLSVTYSDDLLVGFESESKKLLSVERCPWQQENTEPGFHVQSIGKSRRKLSSGDVWLIQRATKETAMALGYYDTSDPAPLWSKLGSITKETARYISYCTFLEFPLRRAVGTIVK